MSKRRIVRAPAKIAPEMKKDLMKMNAELIVINQKLKENTNQLVEEIGRCLDNIFNRLERIEEHCGIVLPREEEPCQTTDAQTSETAMATDTTETSSMTESPSPVEESVSSDSAVEPI